MATDLDAGTNAEITYEITGGMHKGNFSINAKTGLITTARALDYEALAKYELTVTARDGATSPRSSTAKVRSWFMYIFSAKTLSGFQWKTIHKIISLCFGCKIVIFDCFEALVILGKVKEYSYAIWYDLKMSRNPMKCWWYLQTLPWTKKNVTFQNLY